MGELKKIWLAVVIAYVALLPSFYLIFNALNRITMYWTYSKHLAILSAITILGTAYYAAYFAMYRIGRPRGRIKHLCDAVFTVVLWDIAVRTIVAFLNIGASESWWFSLFIDNAPAKLLYYGVIPFAVAAVWTGWTKRFVTGVYFVVSPLMAFLLIWPLTYERFDPADHSLPDRILKQYAREGGGAGTPNVYIFMFDEWSYDRTFPDGAVWDALPRFKALLETSTCFHRAFSPGPTTAVSIPRFLYQTDQTFREKSAPEIWDIVLSRKTPVGDSLFAEAPDAWFTAAIGFWHDYPRLLKGGPEWCVTAGGSMTGSLLTFWGDVRRLLQSQLGWLRWLGLRPPLSEADDVSNIWLFTHEQIHAKTLAAIRLVNSPTFGFFHYCLPHYPYVWDRNGRKAHPTFPLNEQTEKNYMDNLSYLDVVLGDIVDTLKRAGKFDSSLLIMMSDHAWRWDPVIANRFLTSNDENNPMTWDERGDQKDLEHVPLVVKFPYQHRRVDEMSAVKLSRLYALLRCVLEDMAKDRFPDQQIEAAIQALVRESALEETKIAKVRPMDSVSTNPADGEGRSGDTLQEDE